MKSLPRSVMVPVIVAGLVRMVIWMWMPGARFASDEQGYVDAGIALATTGQQDLFWPPLTGWIVAALKTIAPAATLPALRLFWIAIDLANVALIAILAARIDRFTGDHRGRVTRLAPLAYALYLPAVSHAQFVTSEMPALFLLLLPLVILTSERVTSASGAVAGAVLGALLLARANLLPLLVMLPAAALSQLRRSDWLKRTALVIAAGSLVVAAAIARNAIVYGEPTLSRNAAYNLYIGNRDFYAEDLDLLHPRATVEQIEFRRQMFAGTLQYPTLSAAEMQSAAMQWIVGHPAQFVRRASGRLARVLAPKTDVLELAGGESGIGIFSPISIALLGVANLQWMVMVFAGSLGLALLYGRDRRLGLTFVSTIAGSVLLCLVAISKPRYSFVFDPLLILAATLALTSPAAERLNAWRQWWRWLTPLYLFIAWGWIAWTIFALTSRLAS